MDCRYVVLVDGEKHPPLPLYVMCYDFIMNVWSVSNCAL